MERHSWWFLDLLAILAYTGVAAVAAMGIVGGVIRAALVVPLIVFVPGYVVIAAVYPRRDGTSSLPAFDDSMQPPDRYAVSGAERFVLSAVVSVAVVPMVAAIAHFTPMGITLMPVLMGVVGVTVLFTLLTAISRLRVSPEDRYAVAPSSLGLLVEGLFGPRHDDGSTVRILNVVLVVAILLVAASGAFAATQQPKSEQFTNFYLVTDEPGGQGSPPSYASDLTKGQAQSYTVSIENQEGRAVEYTAVVQLQRVETADGGDSVRVTGADQLDTFSKTLTPGEQYNHTHEVTPTASGDDLRIVYLLYTGDPPANPTVQNADYTLKMPVNVSGGGSNSLAPPEQASEVSGD
ncbi:DUF1616 domain-containing protein [Halorussus halophilus]|uniref:DUF1616 domain-containing protein n=1 Tax=Halorussus halophilus TaxID=2650975 RepID=UPI0013013EB6|nr:DUF1616 domain-containing protein [Halorussus halophilus]